MRGALLVQSLGQIGGRIIPADAGSTSLTGCQMAGSGDHPRRCGEHRTSKPQLPLEKGSSPQMRGALRRGCAYTHGARIIPADAGSTCLSAGVTTSGWDHPRRCGEHGDDDWASWAVTGSSPQMRGARWHPGRMAVFPGIIPADAGSTARSPCSPCK